MTSHPTSEAEIAPIARRPAPVAGARSLAPREHGAYGQLALPLVAALAMGRPGLSAVGLAVASAALFLAHEPILVVAGQRGSRALREDGGRARSRLGVIGVVAVVSGGVGLALAPPAARLSVLAPIALVAALAPFIARKREKTAAGELLAAAALASASLPVALAAGVTPAAAWSALGAWCLVFAASTLAVRAVVAHARAPLAFPRRIAAPAAAFAVGLVGAGTGAFSLSAALGAAPLLVLALVIAARPPGPRSLRTVGWALVAGSVALGVSFGASAHA